MSKRLSHTTKREIEAFFAEKGIRAKKSLGQNFLVDPNLLRVVAEATEAGPDDLLLEIGVGTGSLTEELATRCRRLIGVEIDERLYNAAREALAPYGNVRLVLGNVLDDEGALSEVVRAAVREAQATEPGLNFKVVGDFPYPFATRIIEALLDLEPPPETITGSVQLEVAERILATEGTKAYGYLSVLVQSRARAGIVRKLPPQVYWPTPRVWSALIRIVPEAAPRAGRPSACALKTVTSALFAQRRKTAANALVKADLARDRRHAEALLNEAGIGSHRRADALSVVEMMALAGNMEHRKDRENE